MERRFACVACGKCCYGLLPLTLDDAVAHADRFPLGMMLTPVRQGHKSYEITVRFGLRVALANRRQLAVRITPVSYLPPSMPCPELSPEGLCAIHQTKPSRCRTMPFFPYRDEADQAAQLIPRPGWVCDVSAAAPVVYRDGALVEREDFTRESAEISAQAPVLRAYAETLVATVPGVREKLVSAAAKPVGGDLLLGFSTLLRRLERPDRADIARRQRPVLAEYAARTASDPAFAAFHRHYLDWEREMDRAARVRSPGSPEQREAPR
jgi:Fe-S-cluster containining protein